MITAYRADGAKPFKKNSLVYPPLEKVEDAAILDWSK